VVPASIGTMRDRLARFADMSQPSLPPLFDTIFLNDIEGVGELILVRHGQQDIADRSVASVHDLIDPPLSAKGFEQARCVGERFAKTHIDVVYSSQLLRANDTGKAIAGHHGLDVIVMEELEEIKLWDGVESNKSVAELLGPVRLMGMRRQMARTRMWDSYPFAERSAAFRLRICEAIDGIVESHPGQRVVVACHGGVINAYMAEHLGIAQDMWFRPAHTGVQVMWTKNEQRSLRLLNCLRHLEHDESLVTH
jgi:2,3-bisphosphoglycerate-dependent phosphoglycerate mutase